VIRLAGLALPLLGTVLIARRIVFGTGRRALHWSEGSVARRGLVVALAAGLAALALWAWWPRDQYHPIRANERGTIRQLVAAPASAPTPLATKAAAAAPVVKPGTHLAYALIPDGGATKDQPAVFVITDPSGGAPVVIATDAAPDPTDTSPTPTTTATAFDFDLPDAPREGDSQALAVNRDDGTVKYSIAYSLVTVSDGEDVTNENGAYAFANCQACASIAVSFQVVLVVGQSDYIAPINIAEALNGNCPQCVTAAIAHQIVVTVSEAPSEELLQQLQAELTKLDAIDDLGADTSLDAINQQVTAVQTAIHTILQDSGITPQQEEQQAADATPTDESTPPTDDGTATTTTTTKEPAPADGTTTTETTPTESSGTTTTASDATTP
jgi:putative peptide zinc metalloprotease protein